MNQLPKTLDPIKFAKQQIPLDGQLSLALCPRLQEMADQGDHQAIATMQFGQDVARIYYISGTIKATVNLICQRCNAPMQYEIDHSFALSPVTSDERAKNLFEKSETYEPIMMHNETISVIDMIEDEILLALPMVPKHEEGSCF